MEVHFTLAHSGDAAYRDGESMGKRVGERERERERDRERERESRRESNPSVIPICKK